MKQENKKDEFDCVIYFLIFICCGLLYLYFDGQSEPRLNQKVVLAEPDPVGANIPLNMRQRNWQGPGGSGSCVHASTVMMLRWCNLEAEADHWRKTYHSGEYWYRLHRKLDDNDLTYVSTTRGDADVLEYASKTRRAAVIAYKPAHAILFIGYVKFGGKEYATLIDNNRIQTYEYIEKNTFLSNWRYRYGGCATVLINSPTPLKPHTEVFKHERF